jgi:hypothetical protein
VLHTIKSFTSAILGHDNIGSYLLAYFGVCLLISFPITLGVSNFLYVNGVTAGADPPQHVLFTLKILDTKNPLIQYTQFPGLSNNTAVGYYPSFLHLMLAGLTFVSTVGENVSFSDVLASMQAFMLTVYVIGLLAYAFLIKSIIDMIIYNWRSRVKYEINDPKYVLAYYGITILAFGLFLYSTSPVIQTFRDGGYGEILAMWAILPFYIYFLVIKKRWIISAIILAIIASTHNLSFFWSVGVTIAFFATLLVSGDFNTLKKARYFVPVFLICALPAIIFFYYPILTEAVGIYTAGSSSTSVNWSRQDVIDLIKPNLYYAGLISAPLLLAINGKLLGWLAGWIFAFMPIVSTSNMFTERFAREWSLILGLAVGVCSALIIYKFVFIKYADYRVKNLAPLGKDSPINHKISFRIEKKQVLVAILVPAITLSITYVYFGSQFKDVMDKTQITYYDDKINQGNAYFLNLYNNNTRNQYEDVNKRILVFGDQMNPWLKAMLYGKYSVLEFQSAEDAVQLSQPDRKINDKLLSILKSPNSKEALSAIKEFNIGYISVVDVLPYRWYTQGIFNLGPVVTDFVFNTSNAAGYFNLEQKFTREDDGGIRIYSIDETKVDRRLAGS